MVADLWLPGEAHTTYAHVSSRILTYADVCWRVLAGFWLPGEAQKIDRMMEKFAERFCKVP